MANELNSLSPFKPYDNTHFIWRLFVVPYPVGFNLEPRDGLHADIISSSLGLSLKHLKI